MCMCTILTKAMVCLCVLTQDATPESGRATSGRRSSDTRSQRDIIVHQYEKKIRKTRKVADRTEQTLKQHQAALIHFKKELSRHLTKLQQLSNEGNPQATRRVKEVRTKLTQVNKILPYLSKYVAVNRQAEIQTVAVLKERCNVELTEWQKGGASKPSDEKVPASSSPKSQTTKAAPVESATAEGAVAASAQTETPLSVQDAAFFESKAAPSHGQTAQSTTDASTSRDATLTPPTAIKVGVQPAGEATTAPPTSTQEENQYAALSVARPPHLVESSSRGNYAKLDLLPSSVPSASHQKPTVNYVRVNFDPVKGAVIVNEPKKNEVDADQVPQSLVPGPQAVSSSSPKTFPQRRSPCPTEPPPPPPPSSDQSVPVPSSVATSTATALTSSTGSASTDASSSQQELDRVRSPPPPPVAKKPSRNGSQRSSSGTPTSSPMHRPQQSSGEPECGTDGRPTSITAVRESFLRNSGGSLPENDERPLSGSLTKKDVEQVTEGTPSVLERIQVRQYPYLRRVQSPLIFLLV